MNIRIEQEEWEKKNLSKYATKSISTKGRSRDEEPCPVRTEFQKDRDRILHSLSFRLLKHKTQVFLSTSGEVFRTRLTHTLEVASIARYIARGININQDLVEAIALGHDLGHTPFGHIGEEVLNELTTFKFIHSEQSVRVVELLENNGMGLNLTGEVKDGIREHSKGTKSITELHNGSNSMFKRAATIEGEVVQFSDWFAYINHDTDDAFNMGIISKDDLPEKVYDKLGSNFRQRLVTILRDVIESSRGKEHIYMSNEILTATDELRQFLYNHVYKLPQVVEKEDRAREILVSLYKYYLKNYNLVVKAMSFMKDEVPERGTCDFIASLTDIMSEELYDNIIN